MSKCDMTIRFKQDSRKFQAGDTVAGTVTVNVNQDVTCTKLLIEFLWQTHGKGNRDTGIIDSTTVSDLAWIGNSSYTYDFSFTIPAYPLTYHGHILNVDFYVQARADIPWAIDPKVSEDILVEVHPQSHEYYQAEITREREATQSQLKYQQAFKKSGWIALFIAAAVLLFLFIVFWWFIIFAAIILSIPVLMRRFASKRLGNVSISPAENDAITPGQRLPLSLSFQPGKAVSINKAMVTLKCQEICVSGSGTNRRTHRHTLHEEQQVLSGNIEAFALSYQEFRAEFAIPELQAYSFKSSDNKLEWKLFVHIDIPRYPDYKKEIELRLIPTQQHQS